MKCATFLLCFFCLVSCAAQHENSAFTFFTGVRVESDMVAADFPGEKIEIEKTDGGYIISVNSYFDCGVSEKKPYLDDSLRVKATLVMDGDRSSGFLHPACNEKRNIKVSIKDRLNTGEVLYVVSKALVIGHLIVP